MYTFSQFICEEMVRCKTGERTPRVHTLLLVEIALAGCALAAGFEGESWIAEFLRLDPSIVSSGVGGREVVVSTPLNPQLHP